MQQSNTEYMLAGWLILVCTYQYLAVILFKFSGGDFNATALYFLKEFVTVFIALALSLKAYMAGAINKQAGQVLLWWTLLITLLLCDALRVPADLSFLKNLRHALLLPSMVLIYFLLRSRLILSAEFNLGVLKVVAVVNIVICAAEFTAGEVYYDFLGLRDFKEVELSSVSNYSGVKGHFETSDMGFLSLGPITRLQGLFLEPTYNAFFCLISIYVLGLRNKLISAFLLVIGFLTFSKLFIAGLIFLVFEARIRANPFIVMACIFCVTVSIGLLFNNVTGLGFLSHARGLLTGLEISGQTIWGLGLGEAGNHNRYGYPNVVNGEFGGESAIGGLLAQLGVRVVPYLVVLGLLIHDSCRRVIGGATARISRAGPRVSAGPIICCAFFITLIASASALSYFYSFMAVYALWLISVERFKVNQFGARARGYC